MSGLITSALLAIARVAGETAPLILLVGYTAPINFDPFSGDQATLPMMVWDQLGKRSGTTSNDVHRGPRLGRRADPGAAGADPERRCPAAGQAGPAEDPMTGRRPHGTRHDSHSRREHRSDMAKRIDVEDVNVFYSDFLAVEGASINIAPLYRHRVHRPVRLREVDLPADPQPDARGDPRRSGQRQGDARRRGPLRPRRRPGERPPHRRHGVPEGEPVPDDVDLRQRRSPGTRSPAPARTRARSTTSSNVRSRARTCGKRSSSG